MIPYFQSPVIFPFVENGAAISSISLSEGESICLGSSFCKFYLLNATGDCTGDRKIHPLSGVSAKHFEFIGFLFFCLNGSLKDQQWKFVLCLFDRLHLLKYIYMAGHVAGLKYQGSISSGTQEKGLLCGSSLPLEIISPEIRLAPILWLFHKAWKTWFCQQVWGPHSESIKWLA